MKHFIRTNDRGEQEMCYGRSTKEVATDMGLSVYKFKQMGWIKTEDRKVTRFKLVAKGETVNKASIFTGPFDEQTFQIAKQESEDEMNAGIMARRKKNFSVKMTDVDGRCDDVHLSATHNGYQWSTIALTEEEVVKTLTVMEMWLHKRKQNG